MQKDELNPVGKTGWERDNRVHFDEIVDLYDKTRLDYPDELFKDIFLYSEQCAGQSDSKKAEDKKAIEIGVGTGKATVPFLNAGYAVTAVELGKNMSEFLMEKFKDNSKFAVINSTFEDVSLENESYDLIYAEQKEVILKHGNSFTENITYQLYMGRKPY